MGKQQSTRIFYELDTNYSRIIFTQQLISTMYSLIKKYQQINMIKILPQPHDSHRLSSFSIELGSSSGTGQPKYDSISSLMRENRFSMKSRQRLHGHSGSQKSLKKSKQIKDLKKCMIFDGKKSDTSITNPQEKDSNALNLLASSNPTNNDSQQKILITKQELLKFTKQFASEKASLQEQNVGLDIKIKGLNTRIEELTRRNQELINSNYEIREKYDKKIEEITQTFQHQLQEKKEQIIDLNHELVKSKMRLQEQILDVKRCRQFLSIKDEIIYNMEWGLRKQPNQSSQQSLKSTYRAQSLQNTIATINRNQKDNTINPKLKKLNLKKRNTTPMKNNESEKEEPVEMSDKINRLVAAVRDRDLQLVRLKQENQSLRNGTIADSITTPKVYNHLPKQIEEQPGIFSQIFQQ